MASPTEFWITVVAGGLVTYGIRVALFLVAGRLTTLPPVASQALRMIPPAALAALSIPALLRPGGAETAVSLVSPELAAGVIAGLVAWRWKNLLATIAAGMVAVMMLTALTG